MVNQLVGVHFKRIFWRSLLFKNLFWANLRSVCNVYALWMSIL